MITLGCGPPGGGRFNETNTHRDYVADRTGLFSLYSASVYTIYLKEDIYTR